MYLENNGIIIGRSCVYSLPIGAQGRFVGRIGNQIDGIEDVGRGERLIIVPGDAVFQVESILGLVVGNIIAFGQIRNQFSAIVIFEQAVIDELGYIRIDIVGWRQNRIDIGRLADRAFDVFSAVSGDRFGLGQIDKSPPTKKRNDEDNNEKIKQDLFLEI